MGALYLAPILRSGLADSDLFLSHLKAMASLDGLSSLSELGDALTRFARLDGQISPIRAVAFSPWLLDPPISMVKAAQLFVVLINIATFALLSRRLFHSSRGAVLATAVLLISWQLRFPHDPTVGSSFQWPVATELVFIALYAIIRWIDAPTIGWLAASIMGAGAAEFAETGIWPIIALLALIPLLKLSTKRRWFLSIGLISLSVLALINGTGSTFRSYPWQRSEYGSTVVRQIFAAVPTTYRALGNVAHDGVNGSARDSRFDSLPDVDVLGWFAILAISITAAAASFRSNRLNSDYTSAAIIGSALWLGASLGIGPPAYWRHELPWGQSFEVIYVAQFGFGLLGATTIMFFSRKLSIDQTIAATVVGLSLFFIGYGNVRANAFALDRFAHEDFARSIVERAGYAGFFDKIAEGSTIAVSPNSGLYDNVSGSVSDAKYSLFQYTQHRYAVISAREIQNHGALCINVRTATCDASRNVFVLRVHTPLVIEPQLSLTRWAKSSGSLLYGDRGIGFAIFPDSRATRSARVLIASSQRGLRFSRPYSLGPNTLAYEVKRTCGPVPLPDVFKPAVPHIRWGSGFDPPTTPGQVPYYEIGGPPMRGSEPLFRWAGHTANLIITRSDCNPLPMIASFAVDTSEPGPILVQWQGKRLIEGGAAHNLRFFYLAIAASSARDTKVTISTNDGLFDEERWRTRIEGDRSRPHRMIVVTPQVADAVRPPLKAALNPTGGLL